MQAPADTPVSDADACSLNSASASAGPARSFPVNAAQVNQLDMESADERRAVPASEIFKEVKSPTAGHDDLEPDCFFGAFPVITGNKLLRRNAATNPSSQPPLPTSLLAASPAVGVALASDTSSPPRGGRRQAKRSAPGSSAMVVRAGPAAPCGAARQTLHRPAPIQPPTLHRATADQPIRHKRSAKPAATTATKRRKKETSQVS